MNERYQGMQQASLQGQQHVSHATPNDQVDLPDDVTSMLAAERDAEIKRLRDRATELETLSPQGFLKVQGLSINDLKSFDLTGRMAKRGWTRLWWSTYNSGWQASSLGWEGSVSRVEVEKMLRGDAS